MNKIGEYEEAIFQSLGADDRREILRIIAREGDASYTEILGELNMTTGNLNYHLKQLEGFIEKDAERRYRLTPLGGAALKVLTAASTGTGDLNDLVDLARVSQKGSTHPTVTRLLTLGIVFNLLILTMYSYMAYTIVTEGGPLFAEVILAALIVIFTVTLSWLIRGLKTAPPYVRRIERRLGLVNH
jgi:DNA-binding transcriptional ArsR family regulator